MIGQNSFRTACPQRQARKRLNTFPLPVRRGVQFEYAVHIKSTVNNMFFMCIYEISFQSSFIHRKSFSLGEL